VTRWKIFVTFFQNLYDGHYSVDRTWNPGNFTFVKVNDRYPQEMGDNRLPYDIFVEHDFLIFRPNLQEKGYCENSVMWHLYKNGVHRDYDYIGFIEYDHVLTADFTQTMQKRLNDSSGEIIFSFQYFTFRQLWDQAIIMNPYRREKVDGRADSPWNCIKLVLKDYNDFYQTDHMLERLVAKDCFPICHSLLMPSAMFDRLMTFQAAVMESGKVEGYHRHNWRAPAVLMERYLAVSLALEDAPIDCSILLEHRELPVKVLKPDWFAPSHWRKTVAYLQKKF
jgi:hypothetical protein